MLYLWILQDLLFKNILLNNMLFVYPILLKKFINNFFVLYWFKSLENKNGVFKIKKLFFIVWISSKIMESNPSINKTNWFKGCSLRYCIILYVLNKWPVYFSLNPSISNLKLFLVHESFSICKYPSLCVAIVKHFICILYYLKIL